MAPDRLNRIVANGIVVFPGDVHCQPAVCPPDQARSGRQSTGNFSTLREESTGRVSKRTLQRRHPDMIWSADTVNGERVLFLLEFQRTVDRLMALRTTTYTALTLEGIAAGMDFRPGDPLPD